MHYSSFKTPIYVCVCVYERERWRERRERGRERRERGGERGEREGEREEREGRERGERVSE
jgi:hypothetical protein